MDREVISPDALCPPPEPYSYAIRTGDTIYMAGQVAFDRAGNVVGTTVAEQAEQVWANIAATLAAAGATVHDIVKVTYYMRDLRLLPEEIAVRTRVFAGGDLPCVTAVQAAALGLPDLQMEVDVIAVRR